MMQSENVGLMVWSPLAGGLLSGNTAAMAKAKRAVVVWSLTSRR
jgi:aryl-alcohol dehydrogenase-like predicted oxidoreductase